MSLVESLIDEVADQVRRAGRAGRVIRLDLTVGRLSGVHVDSLRFAFQFLAPDTIVEDAELAVREVPGQARCNDCGAAFPTAEYLPVCSNCSGANVQVEGGREMVLDAIELDEEE
jgi:hydrogenase nickel incorporation protein HypA/HybF